MGNVGGGLPSGQAGGDALGRRRAASRVGMRGAEAMTLEAGAMGDGVRTMSYWAVGHGWMRRRRGGR